MFPELPAIFQLKYNTANKASLKDPTNNSLHVVLTNIRVILVCTVLIHSLFLVLFGGYRALNLLPKRQIRNKVTPVMCWVRPCSNLMFCSILGLMYSLGPTVWGPNTQLKTQQDARIICDPPPKKIVGHYSCYIPHTIFIEGNALTLNNCL